MRIARELMNIFTFISLIVHKKRKNKDIGVDNIHVITFRKFHPEGGAGGGGAVQSANKILFGDNLDGTPVKYSFYEDNKYSLDRKNNLWDLFGAVEFVKQKTIDDKNCAYVTHDYGTAFGLYLLRKKYVLVSHLQGSRVEEKKNFGEKFTKLSEKIIQYCEKKAFARAHCVCFPSHGAYEFFCNSKFKTIKPAEFRKGETLYNTLYAFPAPEKMEEVEKAGDCTTFLSIGRLTHAKGLDRHPQFFAHLLKNTRDKIRYVFVGTGILEKEIVQQLDQLKAQYSNFDYTHIPKCSYPQIQYLQDISDAYLMLHRISIFDLATLEVMNKGKAVILSNVGGNPEFNRNNNIILADSPEEAVDKFLAADIESLGRLNKETYETCFSNEVYKKAYVGVLEDLHTAKNAAKLYKYFPSHPQYTAPEILPFKDWVFISEFRRFERENDKNTDKHLQKLYQNLDAQSIEIADSVWQRYTRLLPVSGDEIIRRDRIFSSKEIEEQKIVIDTFRKDFKSFKFPKKKQNHFDTSVSHYEHGLRDLTDKEKNYIKGSDFIDLGAYIGDSILVMDKYAPRKILALEIENANFELLRDTLSLNSIDAEVIALKKGISDRKDIVQLFGDSVASTLLKHDHQRYFSNGTIECDTVDNLVKDYNLEPKYIKIDVEGYELKAIKGAIETIKTFRPIMMISIYHSPYDFLFIKPLIEELNLDYKFHIRNHNPFDPVYETVLMAIPELR